MQAQRLARGSCRLSTSVVVLKAWSVDC